MEENIVVPPAGPETGPIPAMHPVEMQNMAEPEKPKRKYKVLIIAAIVVVVLALGAYVAYAEYYSPSRVWQRFTANSANTLTEAKVASESFNFSYEDKGVMSGEALKDPSAAMFNNIKLAFNGTAYANNTNTDNPEMSMDFQYSFGSGDTSISSAAKMIFKGQDLYLNLGNNPLVSAMMSYLSPDKKVDWIKINSQDLQTAQASVTSKAAPAFDYKKYTKDYEDIVKKYMPKIVLLDKFIDKQDVRGVATLHYSNKADKVQVKAMLNELAAKMVQQSVDQEELTQDQAQVVTNVLNKVINDFVDRTKATTFETWVGVKDNQLHKIKYSVSAPSLASLISLAINQGAYLDQQTDPDKITDIVLKGLSFDGVLSGEQEIYDIGKIIPVTPPTDYLDLANKIKELKAQPTTTPESINQLPANPLPYE